MRICVEWGLLVFAITYVHVDTQGGLVKSVRIIHILWTEQVKCAKFNRNIKENE